MDERKAIDLCIIHRDPVGFEYLVRSFRREAFMHAVGMLGNEQDAADACQDSFLRAFSALPRVRTMERFYPWFYTILRNCCLNLIARRKTVADHTQREQQNSDAAQDEFSPSVLLEQTEEQRLVWRTLAAMTSADREILALKYIEGRCYDEIANLLGIPRGTVMSRLFYARQAFRETHDRINNAPRETP